jgi:hypothetical protein
MEHIGDSVYQDKMLNEIIQGHKDQQLLVKQHFEEQKINMMNHPSPVSPANPETVVITEVPAPDSGDLTI